MNTLRNTITDLAQRFAAGVLDAIRSASLEDILAETNRDGGGARRGPGRPRGAASAGAAAPAAPAAGRGGRRRGGRLGRRSASDIGALVERIVGLLQQHPDGLRAEEIRQKLGLEAKELPRPITEALAQKKISKQGQKRATTYFAKGSGGGASAGGAGGGARRGGRGAGGGKRAAAKRGGGAKRGAAAKRGGAKRAAGKKAASKTASAGAAQTNGTTSEASA